MIVHQARDERRDVFGQLVLIGGVVGEVDLAHARDLGGRIGDACAALARDEQMHFAQLACGGDHGQGRVLHAGVVVFDQNESFHCVYSFIRSGALRRCPSP